MYVAIRNGIYYLRMFYHMDECSLMKSTSEQLIRHLYNVLVFQSEAA